MRATLGDNPSDHDVLILLVQAFETYMTHDQTWKRETTSTLNDLHAKVTHQNGAVADLHRRADNHDAWHGNNDSGIAERVATLWQDRHDLLVTKGVFLTTWRIVAWLVGTSIFGAMMGKMGNVIGWW